MSRTGRALRLMVFLGENDRWHRVPLYHEIVRRARDAGLMGATVLHGCEGYGASTLIHTTRLLDLAEDLPVLVIIVDTEDRIRDFLPQLDDVITEGMVTLEEVEVLHHLGRQNA